MLTVLIKEIKVKLEKSGPFGLQGERCKQGIKGDNGEKGIKGSDGTVGNKGNRGPRGETGLKGNIGQKGEVGQQGVRGEKAKEQSWNRRQNWKNWTSRNAYRYSWENEDWLVKKENLRISRIYWKKWRIASYY